LITFLGGISSGLRENMETRFVGLNNVIIKKMMAAHIGFWKNALLLLPHCLQNDDCEHRITRTITNCADCGKCNISEISKVARGNLITVKVATGGRLAKRWVEEQKPDFVIAVACERELCEGIAAVYPLPVVAVPNERPNGPCLNTTVDVKIIQREIRNVLGDIWTVPGCK
jgi:hypothetical protein